MVVCTRVCGFTLLFLLSPAKRDDDALSAISTPNERKIVFPIQHKHVCVCACALGANLYTLTQRVYIYIVPVWVFRMSDDHCTPSPATYTAVIIIVL